MSASHETQQTISALSQEGYKYGFVTDIESDSAPPGLDEDTVRFISAKKEEPDWLLDWRLAAFRAWQKMTQPEWAKVEFAPIDFQSATYYSAPKQVAGPKSLDEVDPELLRTYEKLGIPLREREALAGVQMSGVAVDAVFDSVSVATTSGTQRRRASSSARSARRCAAPELVLKVSRHRGAINEFLCGA
jgi:Fe-S cluster assembly protein SufB